MSSEPGDRGQTPDYGTHYRHVNDVSDAGYHHALAFYRSLLGPILDSVPRDRPVLDVGCGAGLLVAALRNVGCINVRGIDTCESLVKEAQVRGLPCDVVPANYVQMNAATSAGTYGCIFLLDVLEHVPQVDQIPLLEGIHTLLAPEASLILSVPNANASFGMRYRYDDWTHTCSFTERSLRFVLTSAGFSHIVFSDSEYVRRPRLPWIPRPAVFRWLMHRSFRLLRRLEAVSELGSDGWRLPLSLNLLVVARKEPVNRPALSRT